jgi:hypothetical protein
MKRKILAAAGLIVVLAVPAMGQETKPMGLSLRAGVFLPTSTEARDAATTWFAGGGEYKLSNTNLGTSGAGSVQNLALSVDYFGKSDFRCAPVLLNWEGANNSTFYSIGVGAAFDRWDNGTGGTASATHLAGQVGIGYNFMQGKSPLFVEAKYWLDQKSVLNGFGLYLGIHL